MRMATLVSLAASITLTSAVYPQAPTATASCAGTKPPPIDQLQALARQYHQQALRPELSSHSVLIGFVLDTSCRIVRHAVGRRFANRIPVDSALALLFPGVPTKPFITAGFADASVQRGPAAPWIVWVVLKG